MRRVFFKVCYLLLLMLSTVTFAQEKQVLSLLSNIGLGSKFSNSLVQEKGQGDLSIVSNNTIESATYFNPALLSNLELTSFSIESQSLNNSVTTLNSNYTSAAFSVSNIIIGIPFGKAGAVSAGFRAHSAVGFYLKTDEDINDATGAVNEAYLSYGVRFFKHLSVGFQTSYLFGNTIKEQIYRANLKTTINKDDYNVRGLSSKVAFVYDLNVAKKLNLQLASVITLANQVNAFGTNSFYEAIETSTGTYTPISGSEISSSIIGVQNNQIKSSFGLGLGEKNKWFLGLGYESQPAVSYTGAVFNQTNNNSQIGFKNSTKFNFGGYIIPKKFAYKNYFNKVVYRGGAVLENTGILKNNNEVQNYGMSFGLGLPIGKRISYINIASQFGVMGNVSENLYQEKYMNLSFNMTLSDKWFKKRVIE